MTQDSAKRSVVVDLRCLQDPNYARRGIGRHALTLLRHAPSNVRLVGLTDATLPALLPEAREAVETVHLNAYAASRAGTPRYPPTCFVMMSPMTHDPIFSARLLSDPTLLRTAIVYDFIPRRFPDRYLCGPAERLSYAVALRWLARYDLFAPISRGPADELTALLGVPAHKITVTGCPIMPAFEELKAAPERASPRHLLVVGGGDPRKNPEVVIRAHARSPMMQNGKGIPLVVAGSYGEENARAFRALAAEAGGRAELVEVPGQLPEADLLELYRRALALICASYDEGFSIPVAEGMAAALPCLVSDIAAHAELVVDADCRFPADDDAVLLPKLERIVADAGWRAATLARQADVWPRFRAHAVAGRFWDAVLRGLDVRAPAVLHGYRPRVAMLSPLPPDRSGVADYTAATCVELGRLVDLHVFTETVRPSPLPNVTSILPLGELPHLHSGFDRVINVVGNSHFHRRIFEMLLRYGGACIAHDARMLGFYCALLGYERARTVAGKELGRPVTEAELNVWSGDEGKLEALFLGEIAESATPMVVHSQTTANMLEKRHGVTPAYLPFSIYRPWAVDELTPACRTAARARLGLETNEVVVVTLGFVHDSKAPDDCVWAIELLRGWGIPASLHFVGEIETHAEANRLRALVAKLGLEKRVRFSEGYMTEQSYRDYLVGADLAVQLRTYGLGGLSGALLDCAAAGLPTVTNASLGAAVGVPDYIRCIPDTISPLLLAEALADLLASGLTTDRPEAARRDYSEQRSFVAYAKRLCHVLGLETPATVPAHRVPAKS
jgi:glycosyltransferase involved in cell wall biosynthesis